MAVNLLAVGENYHLSQTEFCDAQVGATWLAACCTIHWFSVAPLIFSHLFIMWVCAHTHFTACMWKSGGTHIHKNKNQKEEVSFCLLCALNSVCGQWTPCTSVVWMLSSKRSVLRYLRHKDFC